LITVPPGCSLLHDVTQDDQTPTSQDREQQGATGVASVQTEMNALETLLHPDTYDWDRVLSF
jgi:hypothetical protein